MSVGDSLRIQEKRRRLALKKTKPTIDTGSEFYWYFFDTVVVLLLVIGLAEVHQQVL